MSHGVVGFEVVAGGNRTAHIMAVQSVFGELLRRFSHAFSHANRGACQGSLPVRSRVDATLPLASFPGPVREVRDAIERSVVGRATTPETMRVSSPGESEICASGEFPDDAPDPLPQSGETRLVCYAILGPAASDPMARVHTARDVARPTASVKRPGEVQGKHAE